jgi:hypothetical protein
MNIPVIVVVIICVMLDVASPQPSAKKIGRTIIKIIAMTIIPMLIASPTTMRNPFSHVMTPL